MRTIIWIRNARVIDPSRDFDAIDDILADNGKVVPFSPSLAEKADLVVDASGCLAVPGLIDFHAHIGRGLTDTGAHPDVMALPNGVTAAVDAGSAGTASISAFVRDIVAGSAITVKAFMNAAAIGVTTGWHTENPDPSLYDENAIRFYFEAFPDALLGLKLRLGHGFSDGFGLRSLERVKRMAADLGKPVCLHLSDLREFSYADALSLLDRGDIVCHCYQGRGVPRLVNAEGVVDDAFIAARERGVLFDSAIATTHHDLNIMRQAFSQGFFPDFIGTDVVAPSAYRHTTFGLPFVFSKHLAAGMPLKHALRAATQTAARGMGLEGRIGTLRPGADADIAVFRLEERRTLFRDNWGNSLEGSLLLVPMLTIKHGAVAYCRVDFNLEPVPNSARNTRRGHACAGNAC